MKHLVNDPRADQIMTALKIVQLAQGMELCDRCGNALYDEALRCDICCGQFGEPPEAAVRAWLDARPGYFRQFGSEGDDAYCMDEYEAEEYTE